MPIRRGGRYGPRYYRRWETRFTQLLRGSLLENYVASSTLTGERLTVCRGMPNLPPSAFGVFVIYEPPAATRLLFTNCR